MTKKPRRKRVLSLSQQIYRGELEIHLILDKSTAVDLFRKVSFATTVLLWHLKRKLLNITDLDM